MYMYLPEASLSKKIPIVFWQFLQVKMSVVSIFYTQSTDVGWSTQLGIWTLGWVLVLSWLILSNDLEQIIYPFLKP